MTPKISLDLSRATGCCKPHCKRSGPFHRHHVRHEKYWINRSLDHLVPNRMTRSFIEQLTAHYEKFRERDTIKLCDYHHVEIHAIYTRIISNECYRLRLAGKMLTDKDATRIMRLCKEACKEWVKKKTLGMNPRKAGWID